MIDRGRATYPGCDRDCDRDCDLDWFLGMSGVVRGWFGCGLVMVDFGGVGLGGCGANDLWAGFRQAMGQLG